MWYAFKRLTLLASVILTFFASCTLLKKSTKNTQQNKRQTNEQMHLERVDLKTANKETKIYTYWKDSLLYQHEHILENTEETKRGSFNTDHKQTTEQQQELKRTEPPDLWLYGGIAIAGISIFAIRFWLKQNRKSY